MAKESGKGKAQPETPPAQRRPQETSFGIAASLRKAPKAPTAPKEQETDE